MKTCLYSFDPLKPHFHIVKLGFTGVYIIWLISVKNIDCGYSLEPPHRGGSNEYPQSMFWAEIWKISHIFIWKFSVFDVEFSIYLNRRVFVMDLENLILSQFGQFSFDVSSILRVYADTKGPDQPARMCVWCFIQIVYIVEAKVRF